MLGPEYDGRENWIK